MLKRTLTIATLLFAAVGLAAQAQIDTTTEETLDATIVAVDAQDRTITVELEANDATETYPVADDAEFYTYDGLIERPVELNDLVAGQRIELEFDGVEGDLTVRKVTDRGEDGDESAG